MGLNSALGSVCEHTTNSLITASEIIDAKAIRLSFSTEQVKRQEGARCLLEAEASKLFATGHPMRVNGDCPKCGRRVSAILHGQTRKNTFRV